MEFHGFGNSFQKKAQIQSNHKMFFAFIHM